MSDHRFRDALRDAFHCGVITDPVELGPRAYSATPTLPGTNLCYELASRLPGQLWPGSQGISWVCGGKGPHGRLVAPEHVPAIIEAQDTCRTICPLPDMPWSVGRLSRAIMAWVGPADRKGAPEALKIEPYHDCAPGRYEGEWSMYDASAYYYTLACRAKHPYPAISKSGRVLWPKCDPDVKARWHDMLPAIGGCKLLRNSLVGAAMGGSGKRVVWMSGPGDPSSPFFLADKAAHMRVLRLSSGPWRSLGLLVLRSGYEIAREASVEVQSVYTATDCVVTTCPGPPNIWGRLGITGTLRAKGEADIIRLGSWKVGPRATLPYQNEPHKAVVVPYAPVPPVEVYRQWLV